MGNAMLFMLHVNAKTTLLNQASEKDNFEMFNQVY